MMMTDDYGGSEFSEMSPNVYQMTWCHNYGNEINKPLHSNGHLPNITHVGGSHTSILQGTISDHPSY
jgi:hypothetical protein